MPTLSDYRATHPEIRDDFSIDQSWSAYTQADHDLWRALFDRQTNLLAGRACEEFLTGMATLAIDRDAIPDFEHLSHLLYRQTRWQVVAVPGLVPDAVFFDHLANRRFPASSFIRRPDQSDYIEEPDIFHDIFGHVPLLSHSVFADYLQAYGRGGLRAMEFGTLSELARLYWYTVEFGLIRKPDGLRIYGSGIVSSATETIYAVESTSPNRIFFDLERVMRTQYRIDDFQETYFVLDSFEELFEATYRDFAPLYERLKQGPTFEPGTVLADDRVLTRGDRHYIPRSHSPG